MWFSSYPYKVTLFRGWFSSYSYLLTKSAGLLKPVGTGFTASVTGSPDYTFSISSFQLILYKDQTSSLSVSIPNGSAHFESIDDRQDGYILINKFIRLSDNTQTETIQFTQFPFDTFSYDSGGRSNSISLRGAEAKSFNTPLSLDIDDRYISSSKNIDDVWTVAIPPDVNINPGDDLTFGANTITVSRVSISVDRSTSTQVITGT